MRSVIDAIAPNDSVERFTALGVGVVEAGGFVIRARRFGHRYRCRNSFTHAATYHASLVLRQILFRLPAPENRVQPSQIRKSLPLALVKKKRAGDMDISIFCAGPLPRTIVPRRSALIQA